MISSTGVGEEMAADLVDGGGRAVVLHRDAVQHGGVGTACPDGGKIGLAAECQMLFSHL